MNDFKERCFVEGGEVVVGSAYPGEGPPTKLFVDEFQIDKFAVCNKRFGCFISDGGYRDQQLWTVEGFQWLQSEGVTYPAFWNDVRFNQPDQPVVGVSLFEALAFAKWDGGRLPTEIEFEKAAVGIDGRLFPWGDNEPTEELATFAPGFSPTQRAPSQVNAHPLGQSPYGCFQLSGNTFEWTADYFFVDTPANRPIKTLENRKSNRIVLKGGAWTTGASRLRPAARWSYTPNLRDNIVGFRVLFDSKYGVET